MEVGNTRLPLEDSLTVVCSLKNVLLQSFGPNARSCLAVTATGKVMVTSRGATILQLLHVAHPIGAMVTRSVLAHHQSNGSGTKSFIFLLSEMLNSIHSEFHVDSGDHLATSLRRQICDDIVFFIRTVIPDVLFSLRKRLNLICPKDCSDFRSICLNIIWTCLQGRFNRQTISSLYDVLENFLRPQFGSCLTCWSRFLNHVLDHFDVVAIENPGRPVGDSAVVEGFVCHREYHRLAKPDITPVSDSTFVVLLLDLDVGDDGNMVWCRSDEQLHKALTWKTSVYETIVRILCDMKVSLVLSDRFVTDGLASACKRKNIHVVHRMEPEDLSYLTLICGIKSVLDFQDLKDPNVIGTSKLCYDMNIHGRSSVCMVGVGPGQKHEVNVCQLENCQLSGQLTLKHLLLCGPSAGICNQLSLCVSDALKCMRAALEEVPLLHELSVQEEDCENFASSNKQHTDFNHFCGVNAVPGGGAWETNMSMILKEFSLEKSLALSSSQRKLCSVVAKSLLHIPVLLLRNSYAVNAGQLSCIHLLCTSDSRTSTDVRRGMAQGHWSVQSGIDGRSGTSTLSDQRIIEPVGSKLSVLLNVLQLVSQVMKADSIVKVTSLATELEDQSEEEDPE